ncbi:MAG: hypothetical protein H5U29_15380 [Pusillimonas sp.]|nr:hypothetical protein [Pusillimonas sp.]
MCFVLVFLPVSLAQSIVPAEPDSCKTRSFTFVMRLWAVLRKAAQVFMVAFLSIMKTGRCQKFQESVFAGFLFTT